MNKSELKKVLKPLIKQCIKEVLLEEKGTLSHIIAEVAGGLSSSKQPIVEEKEIKFFKDDKVKRNKEDFLK